MYRCGKKVALKWPVCTHCNFFPCLSVRKKLEAVHLYPEDGHSVWLLGVGVYFLEWLQLQWNNCFRGGTRGSNTSIQTLLFKLIFFFKWEKRFFWCFQRELMLSDEKIILRGLRWKKLTSCRVNLSHKSPRNWQHFQSCFWFFFPSHFLVLSMLGSGFPDCLLHYPLRYRDETDQYVLARSFLPYLKVRVTFAFSQFWGTAPKCQDLSKIIKIGLTVTSVSSLGTNRRIYKVSGICVCPVSLNVC